MYMGKNIPMNKTPILEALSIMLISFSIILKIKTLFAKIT
jgi:hypothetical protein